MRSITTFLLESHVCERCVCWDFMSGNELNNHDAPKHYPEELLINDNRQLKFKELTFKSLKAAIELCAAKLLSKEWNNNNVTTYCGCNGINTEGSDMVIKRVENILAHQISKEINTENALIIRENARKNPCRYTQWEGGPFWNSCMSLKQFVDPIMHLIFLGITKATKKLVDKWIKVTKRKISFKLIENELLGLVANMGLDWCKIILTESGWVSDNYLAFARITKWYYHPLDSLALEEEYKEPTKELKGWLLEECRNWLKVRGLKSTGKVNELKSAIHVYKTRHEGCPQILNTKRCSVSDVNILIGSLLSCVSKVMIRHVTENDPDYLDREIRLFLSNIHTVQESLMFENDIKDLKRGKPYWLSKYNYICLLNLPLTMKEYGPLINLWEGSNQGEGYLRYAKPRIRDVFSKKWQVNAHVQLLNEVTFNGIINNHIKSKVNSEVSLSYREFQENRINRKKKMYCEYNNIEDFISMLYQRKPLSCVMTASDKYYAVIEGYNDTTIRGIEINLTYVTNISDLSMSFHKVSLDEKATEFDIDVIEHNEFIRYIILLPKMDDSWNTFKYTENVYYIIDSDWCELDIDMQWRKPRSPKCKY